MNPWPAGTRFAVAIAIAVSTLLPACASSRATPADAGPPPASGPALPVPPVSHEGRWLTDAEGRVVLVHGVNLVEKDPPYYPAASGFSDADAQWLADNGFRVVRVGILATGLMPAPGTIDPSYVQQIATTVSLLASHDVYSLIDLHQDGWGPSLGSDGFPAWMTLTGAAVDNEDAGFPLYYEQNPAIQQAFQSFWDDAVGPDDAGLQDDYASMFGAVARALASQPYVIGYDLFNEPWPGTTWDPCLNDPQGCPALDQSELGPAYAKAVAAIRAAGDAHLVFGEPFVLFNEGISTTSLPLPGGDTNAGMAFHVYPVISTLAPNVVSDAVTWSSQTGGALFTTEWGATTDTAPLVTQIGALDSAMVPWIFWSFCCELVDELDASPGGANLVGTTAAAIVEPYPLVVAGTPQSLAITQDPETMTFTYAPRQPDGGAFPAGTVTTFEVPAIAFPSGYAATVTSGWVTSAPCASLLTVEAKPGAESVTVVIQAGEACP